MFSAFRDFTNLGNLFAQPELGSSLPSVGGKQPTVYADFSTNTYSAGGTSYPTYAAWQTAIAGTFTRNSPAVSFNSAGILTTATNNVLRFDYDPITLQSRGLLLEGGVTNLLLQSNTLSTTWTTTNAAVVSAQGTSPDGTNNGWRLNETATTGQHFMQQSVVKAASSIQYTFSVYLKAATRLRAMLQVNNGANGCNATFEMVNGFVAVAAALFGAGWSSPATMITPVGNGWFRCALTISSDTTTAIIVGVFLDGSSIDQPANNNYTGIAGNGLLVYGAQLEQAPVASSYVVTVGSQASRLADSLTYTNFKPTVPGTFVIDERFISGAGTVFSTGPINPGSFLALQTGLVTQSLGWYASQLNDGKPTAQAFQKQGSSFDLATHGSDCLAGGTVVTTSAHDYTGGATSAAFNARTDGSFISYGNTRSFGWWNVRATDTELQRLTTPPIPMIGNSLVYADFVRQQFYYLGAMQANFNAWVNAIGGTYTRGSPATYTNSSGLLATAASNVPRFDYNPITLAPMGFLLESTTVNQVTYSENFTAAALWTAQACTVTPDVAIAPDGNMTADKIVPDVTNAGHRVYSSVSLSNGNPNTWSVFAKAAGYNWIGLTPNDGVNDLAVTFDLLKGVVGTIYYAGVTATITPYPNGWYRCSVTRTTAGSASGFAPIHPLPSDLNFVTTTFAGDGVSGVYVWGEQVEQLGFVTSYIPTAGVTATRQADLLLSSLLYYATSGGIGGSIGTGTVYAGAGTVFVATNPPQLNTVNSRVIGSSRSASAPVYMNGETLAGLYNGVIGLNAAIGSGWNGAVVRVASSFDSAGHSIVANGGPVATDTNSSGWVMYDAGIGSVNAPMYGRMTQLGAWNYRPTDTQLQAMTVTDAPVIANSQVYADFAGGNYYFKGQPQAGFAGWLAAIGGTFTRNSPALYTNSSGVLTSATNGVLRFDYDPITLAPRGILLEGQSTNAQSYSQDFTQWVTSNASIGSSTVAPDGTSTAQFLQEDNTTNIHYVRSALAFTWGTSPPWVISVFAKAGTRNQLVIGFDTGGGVTWIFTLTGAGTAALLNNSIGLNNLIGTITPYPNGWYRCTLSVASQFAFNNSPTFSLAVGGTASYAGNGSSGLYLWGAQVENLGFSTSYIQTLGSTVQRLADVLQYTTPVNVGGGTIATTWRKDNYAAPALADTRMSAGVNGAMPQLRIFNNLASVLVPGYGSDAQLAFTPVNGITYKGAISYTQNWVNSIAVNGAVATTGNTHDYSLSAVTAVKIGNDGFDGVANMLNGTMVTFGYWPYHVSDTQLQALAT